MDTIPQKRCSTCHVFFPCTTDFFHRNKAQRDGFNNECKTCKNARSKIYDQRPDIREKRIPRQKAWNDAHKQEHHDYYQTYNQINQEKIRQQKQIYYRETREIRSQKGKEYYRNHRTEIRIKHLHYYASHRDERLTSARLAYQKNRERRRIQVQRYRMTSRGRAVATTATRNYRLRKQAIPGHHTPEQILDLLKRQRYRCYYCTQKLERQKGKYLYHVEHTFPVTREGASNDISYLVIACPTCNHKKRDKYPWEWFEGGRLL